MFPLLKRLHGELGDKAMTAMLVAHPLPDEVKHALKQQRQQQQQRDTQLQHAQPAAEDTGPAWELAIAALRAGAAAAASAAASLACTDPLSSPDAPCVSLAAYISPDLLQRLQQGQDEETVLKALNELMHIFVNKVGGRVKPEGAATISPLSPLQQPPFLLPACVYGFSAFCMFHVSLRSCTISKLSNAFSKFCVLVAILI